MKKYPFNLMRPFIQCVCLFLRPSTSDRVQYSGLKTLHCTQSDALALPKM